MSVRLEDVAPGLGKCKACGGTHPVVRTDVLGTSMPVCRDANACLARFKRWLVQEARR